MEGWASSLKVLTIFISFHLTSHESFSNIQNAKATDAHSERTRAAVVGVLDLCTSLTAILELVVFTMLSLLGEAGSVFGLHSQTLPQFPKPI
jgi:hypothetical protein